MRDDVYATILFIINSTKGSKIMPNRECFKVLKEIFPHIPDLTIGSIYSSEYMRKMKINHYKISKCAEDLHNRFNAAVEEAQPEGILLRMSDEIDLSPALLARLIVEQRYKDILAENKIDSSTQNDALNSTKDPAMAASNASPTIISSAKETMDSAKLEEAKVENTSNSVSHLKEEAVLTVSKALPNLNSLVEKIENSLHMEARVESTPALDFTEDPHLTVSEMTHIKDSVMESIVVETVKNSKCFEAKAECTNIPVLDLTEGAEAPLLIDSVIETKEKPILIPEVGFTNISALNSSGKTVTIVSEAPPTIDPMTETTKTKTFTETEIKISNATGVTTNSTPKKSESSEESDEETSSDIEDTPSKITITKLMKEPSLIDDPRLSLETFLCTLQDDQYGPIADCVKHTLGLEYEMRLVRLAKAAGLLFGNEGSLRTTGFDKTPDVMLDVPAIVDGFAINWIESKALFGDEETHKGYIDEQYTCYKNRFGPGMVIYWFGFLDKIVRKQDQFLIVENFPKNIIPQMVPQPIVKLKSY